MRSSWRRLGDEPSRKSTSHAYITRGIFTRATCTLGPAGKANNNKAHCPLRCWRAKYPRRRRRRARFRRESPLQRPTLTPGQTPRKTAGPRLEPPGDDKYMPTSYIWDSGQEITGVQGVVAGGVQFDLLTGAVGGGGASCRRGRRIGEGIGVSTDKGGGVRLLPQSEEVPLSPRPRRRWKVAARRSRACRSRRRRPENPTASRAAASPWTPRR